MFCKFKIPTEFKNHQAAKNGVCIKHQSVSVPSNCNMSKQSNENDNNLSNYIQNLDVNVLNVDLSSLEGDQPYLEGQLSSVYRGQQQQEPESRDKQLDQQKGLENDKPRIDNADAYGSNYWNIPGVPQLPEGADPKKICPFCQKTFSHPGSMGRHLDLKKGTEQHPADVIDKMREDVKRRGNIEQIKERRRLRAKRYNAKEEVKQRTRIQRRARDKVLRAKRSAMVSFFNKLGRAQLQPHPTFPRIVLYFLSPNQWPHDPPTLDTYRTLCGELNEKFLPGDGEDATFYEDLMQKVHSASENWMTLTDPLKLEIWIRELRRAAEDALYNTSLYELGNRDELILKSAQKMIESRQNIHVDGETSGEDDSGKEDETGDDKDRSDANEEGYYNHAELAAVAEAVVNTSKNIQENTDHLDPQLMR